MLQEERLIKITGHLKEEGSDNYANIANLLGVSQYNWMKKPLTGCTIRS